MLMVEGFDELPADLPPSILTVGVFDGIHVGHQEILNQIVSRAKATSSTAGLLTFSPHPRKIIASGDAPPSLQTTEQKTEMLSNVGIDLLISIPFTRRLSLYTPEKFLEKILFHPITKEIYVGSNFRFGHRRTGNFELLKGMGDSHGIHVGMIKRIKLHGHRVSSTLVRKAVRNGDVGNAAHLLGRPYQISGTVIRGEGRGQTLGFPTANIQVENELVPLPGVYVTISEVNGLKHPSVTNVGYRPTIQPQLANDLPVVESHLLEHSTNLYGLPIRTDFLVRLRPERRFDSLDSLQLQIDKDVKTAKAYLKESQS
jgi:riboflavin kinase/FMN adenylyltransferase